MVVQHFGASCRRLLPSPVLSGAVEIDMPNGGISYVVGNLIQQVMQTDNPNIICYGEECLSNTEKDLYVINNTIVNDRGCWMFVSISSVSSIDCNVTTPYSILST
jgi:hypothetical protein